jgi:CRISPR-associated protein Cas1
LELHIDALGAFLGRRSERLQVTKDGDLLAEAPLVDLERVIFHSRAGAISLDAITSCAENGISVYFLDGDGEPLAQVHSPFLTATVATRRSQILAALDERGTFLVKRFLEAKLRNQANLLKYYARHRKRGGGDTVPLLTLASSISKVVRELHATPNLPIDQIRDRLLPLEGRAGQLYWEGVRVIAQNRIGFAKREHRAATDPLNVALNYGYGILYSRVWGAVALAGLEPFAGFLHVDRPGKPSLVLDFVEEFRQPVVDRAVLGMVGRGEKMEVENGRLAADSRHRLAAAIVERLQSMESYRGQKAQLGAIIQRQARGVAAFLRGEARTYRAYVGRW